MKKIELEIPESMEEFYNMSADQHSELLKKIREQRGDIDNFISFLVKDAIIPIMEKNPDIEEVSLDHSYEYNDEGYAPSYVMPVINGDYETEPNNPDVQEEMDYACADFSDLMTRDAYVSREDVKLWNARKLDKDLPKNKPKSKSRYKM